MADEENDTFNVLALDGGGVKGIYSAAVLAYLEQDLDTNIADHFDLITGTSTGGIIALGLGMGLRPSEVLQFYCDYGHSIFYGNRLSKGAKWLFRRKYSAKPLIRALQKCFGAESLLCESQTRLVIPAYNVSNETIRLFKTPHDERLRRDWRIPVWQIALATAAAPTFFPACREIDEQRLIDGGVWANNPAIFGVVEAIGVLGIPIDRIQVLSIGTTSENTRRPKSLDTAGLWGWRKHIVDVMMSGQSLAATSSVEHLLGKERVSRVNVSVPRQHFVLDDVVPELLIAEAAGSSQHFSEKFSKTFASHKAAGYKPLYGTDA